MSKRAKGWCDICRDEDPDLSCSTRGCRRKFHVDCLRNSGLLDPNEDLDDFTCQTCQDEEAEAECYKCHKLKEGATLLVCDVCNRGAHIECAGLKEEPQGEEWICPVCSPNQPVTKSTMASVGGGRPKLGNVDICYVCQKGGKLLCCDLCDQSFHPKCIDPEFLELTLREEGEDHKWGCPICKGQDPLKNMGHKRMTKSERQKRSAEWQKCVKVQSKRCRANRDRFLWDCRSALKPFVSPEVLAKIKKSAMAAKASDKQEMKREAIPKKKPAKAPPPPPPAAAPFKRMTSTSLRAAVASDGMELEERRPMRRLRKEAASPSNGTSGRTSRSHSIENEETKNIPRRRLTRQQSESSEDCRSEASHRVKRRRLAVESDDDDTVVKSGDGSSRSDVKKVEGLKNDENREMNDVEHDSSRRASLKSEESDIEILKSENYQESSTSSSTMIDDFKLKEDNKDEDDDHLMTDRPAAKLSSSSSASPNEPLPSINEVEETLVERGKETPTVSSSATTVATNTALMDAAPDENENSAVSYQRDDLLKDAEVKAAKKSLAILREGVSLKNYQRWGVNWLMDAFENKAGAILADEMGLGKTIQTLTFLSALKSLDMTGPHLVVVPLSTVGNWAREIRRFTPQLTYTKICGSRQEREHSMSDGVAMSGIYDIFITTYETCVTEEWFFTDQFKWQCVILDEAHRIKNEAARIRHSLDRVDCNMRVLLTGTPLQNNIKELFTLLNFLFPDVISSSGIIEATFQPNNKKGPQNKLSKLSKQQPLSAGVDESLMDNPAAVDESKVESITNLLSKLMLRRTKDLVVRLPKKIPHDVWLPLSPYAATWYRRLLEITADVDHSSIRKLLGAVIKMRICCCHPRGLVSREAQLQNFMDNLKCLGWPEPVMNQVVEECQQLKDAEDGWKHVFVSSKLIFLDKLLRQLHHENMEKCSGYKEDYLYTRSNQLRKAVQERTVKLEGLMSTTKTSSSNINNGNSSSSSSSSSVNDAVTTMQRLKRELDILEQPEESGGGLRGLQEMDLNDEDRRMAFGRPSTNDSLFMKYLYPWDPKQEKEDAESMLMRSNSIEEDGMDDNKGLTTSTSGTKTPLSSPQASSAECAADGEESSSSSSKQAPIRPHKVLIFTQFQLVLTELEAYCIWRGWSYMRLDGSTNKMIRELDTREFNSNDSNHFVYLISTRAGGLGINLVTANHVILFDEDWNPFVDLQAIDRAHRIGQTRNVLVWKLMTEWTVEERMAIRRQQKLKLDKLLIQANVESIEETDEGELGASDEKLSTEEIRRLIQYGKTALMEMSFENGGIENLSLEELLNRKRRELKEVEDGKTKAGTTSTDETPSILQSSPAASENESDVQSIVGDSSIDECTSRHRRQSISLKEALHEGEEEDEATKKLKINDLEADDEENGLSCQKTNDDEVVTVDENGNGVEDNNNNNEDNTTAVIDDGAIAAALEEEGRNGRPKRERKKPKLLYNPLEWKDKVKVERKLIRERFCFRCGDSGPPVQDASSSSSSKEKGKERKKDESSKHDSGADPLVGCMRCPKVYHQHNCLGLDKMPPRSFMCPWHECCVCFRRSGAAGGLLIHCAECPTAFCFDCFPPEYRRYVPPPQYYESLQKRGWPVTPQKLVTFLCSRCKALKEQERRRKLSKQQLEAENKTRKGRDDSVRDEARKTQQAAKEAKQKEADDKKLFAQSKKRVDDGDRVLAQGFKKAYEGLYHHKYLDLINTRREVLVAEQKASTKQGTENNKGGATSEESGHEQQQSGTEGQEKSKTAKPKAAARKRIVIPERLKSPADSLKLCDNCLLPKHTAPTCPFPLESIKQKVEPTEVTGLKPGPKAKSKAAPDSTAQTSDVTKATSDATGAVVELSDTEGKGTEKSIISNNNDVAASSSALPPKPTRMTRPKNRLICALCSSTTPPLHARKHCDQLTDVDRDEYAVRREKIQKLITLLNEEKNSVRPVGRLAEVYSEPDFDPMSVDDRMLEQAKKQMTVVADKTLVRCLKEAGLENVLYDPSKEFIKTKSKKEPLVQSTSSSSSSGSRDVGKSKDHMDKQRSSSSSSGGSYPITNYLPRTSSIGQSRETSKPSPPLPPMESSATSEEESDDASSSTGSSIIVEECHPPVRHQDSIASNESLRKKRKMSSMLDGGADGSRPLKRSRISHHDASSSSSSSRNIYPSAQALNSDGTSSEISFVSHQRSESIPHLATSVPHQRSSSQQQHVGENSSSYGAQIQLPTPRQQHQQEQPFNRMDDVLSFATKLLAQQDAARQHSQTQQQRASPSSPSRHPSNRPSSAPQQIVSSSQQISSPRHQPASPSLSSAAFPQQLHSELSNATYTTPAAPSTPLQLPSSPSLPTLSTLSHSNGVPSPPSHHPYHQQQQQPVQPNSPEDQSIYIDIDSDSQSTKS